MKGARAVLKRLMDNLNAATYSRSKSLLMVFGARVVIAHQTRIADAGINTLRCKLGNEKRDNACCAALLLYLDFFPLLRVLLRQNDF